MRFRTVLVLIGAVLLIAVFAVFYSRNAQVLRVEVDLFGLPVAVGVLILFAYLAGVLTLIPMLILRDARIAAERYRVKRAERLRTEVHALYDRAMTSALNGRHAIALELFARLLERQPEHRDALIAAGDLHRRMGHPERAAEFHRQAVRLEPADLGAHYALAEDHEMAGDLRAAEEVYRTILEIEPKRSLEAHRKLQDVCVAEGRWEEAASLQDKMERIRVTSEEARAWIRNRRLGLQFEEARSRIAGGDAKGALSLLRKVIKGQPDFTPAYVLLGEAAIAADREEEGLGHWREGYVRTGSPVFLGRMEEHFLSRQNPSGAIAAFRELLERNESGVLPRFFLGRLFSRLEMVEEAWGQFVELRGEVTRSPTLDYYLAKVHERRDELAEACRLYRGVVQKTGVLDLRYGCTGCALEAGEWQAYCPECRTWDTFRVEWTEPSQPQEVGLGEIRPVWSTASASSESS